MPAARVAIGKRTMPIQTIPTNHPSYVIQGWTVVRTSYGLDRPLWAKDDSPLRGRIRRTSVVLQAGGLPTACMPQPLIYQDWRRADDEGHRKLIPDARVHKYYAIDKESAYTCGKRIVGSDGASAQGLGAGADST
jgi:hypothetical protein